MTPHGRKYRTTRAIVIPAGTRIVMIGRMKKDMYRLAQALLTPDVDTQYELLTDWDRALKTGLIEEVPDGA